MFLPQRQSTFESTTQILSTRLFQASVRSLSFHRRHFDHVHDPFELHFRSQGIQENDFAPRDSQTRPQGGEAGENTDVADHWDELYSAVGAEMTVKMLWQWAYMYELRPSFLLLNGIIIMAGTTLSVMVFIMPSFAPQLIEVINKSVDSLEKTTSLADRDFSVLHQAERTVQMSTIEMISQGEGMRVNLYWKNHKEALLRALSRAVNITTGSTFHEELLATACLIHDALGVPRDPTKYHPLILSGSLAVDEEHKKENDFWKAYTAIRQVTLSDRCHAPGCLETFTSTGRKFQNCSGCKRVSYCSEKCQKRAWKLGEAPHKIICPLVKEFSDRIKLQFKFADGEVLPPDVVEGMCRKGGVDEMEAHTIRWYFELLDTLLIVRNPYDSRVGEGR